MSKRVRKAAQADMDEIFLMGRDAWGKGEQVHDYLASCWNSPKYLKGEWYLLDHEEHGAIASLVLYRLTDDVAGIGSIATVPERRKQGFGAHLVQTIVGLLDLKGTKAIFLFSDISPRFYERFGFRALPAEHQKHPGSVCMIRVAAMDEYLKSSEFRLPAYF